MQLQPVCHQVQRWKARMPFVRSAVSSKDSFSRISAAPQRGTTKFMAVPMLMTCRGKAAICFTQPLLKHSSIFPFSLGGRAIGVYKLSFSFCFWKHPAPVNHGKQRVRAVSSFGGLGGQDQTTNITEVAHFITALGPNYIILPSLEKSPTLWASIKKQLIFFFIKQQLLVRAIQHAAFPSPSNEVVLLHILSINKPRFWYFSY